MAGKKYVHVKVGYTFTYTYRRYRGTKLAQVQYFKVLSSYYFVALPLLVLPAVTHICTQALGAGKGNIRRSSNQTL
jgi:hypothetical protein